MSPELRQQVRQRAGDRCEYCRLPDWLELAGPFHVEHIIARQHRGPDEFSNLAWACSRCNHRTGASFHPCLKPSRNYNCARSIAARELKMNPIKLMNLKLLINFGSPSYRDSSGLSSFISASGSPLSGAPFSGKIRARSGWTQSSQPCTKGHTMIQLNRLCLLILAALPAAVALPRRDAGSGLGFCQADAQ
jgi:HNH endonuclease